jgi:hypothetical protein
MTIDDPRVIRVFDAIEVLASTDIATMDRAGLSDIAAARRLVVGFCDQIDLAVARRSRELEAEGKSESASDVLREGGRRSNRDAAAAAGRAETAEQLPSFGDALGEGTVTSGHLDALRNATARLTDEQKATFATHEAVLLKRAANISVERFERECRDLARMIVAESERDNGKTELDNQRDKNTIRSWIDRDTGMGHIHSELDPESHAKVLAAMRAKVRSLRHQQDQRSADDPLTPLTHEQLEAEAFVEIFTNSDALDTRVPEVIVLLDYQSLLDGWHPGTVSETVDGIPIPPDTVRRYCCSANIIPAVLGSNGQPLDVGAGSRLATPAQRRAVYTMYRTCAVPGCCTPVGDCEIHHLDEWITHQLTDLDRLLPLCTRHHHLVHEGGWRIDMNPDRVVTLYRPDGTLCLRGPTIDRLAG